MATDLAYIAGFIDADGCMIIDRQKRTNKHHKQHYYYVPRITIANRHRGVLDFINSKFDNLGSLTLRELNKKNPRWSNAYQLRFSSKAAYRICKEILPYLLMKRRQAELMIEMGELKSGTQSIDVRKRTEDYESKSIRYDEIFHAVRSMNKTGQEYFNKYGVNSGEIQIGQS